MINDRTFILKWTDDGEEQRISVNRETFQDLMEAIRTHFYWDNVILTELIKIVSKATTVEINMDKNRDLDIPVVNYEINDRKGKISIPENQKIIWVIFEECCKL